MNIVAVGASAGGLDALRELFAAAVPSATIAYVVVTHLPAHHVSHLAELLARASALPAIDAQAGQRIEGGNLYVMPPGKLMGLKDGIVFFEEKLLPQPAPKPIDFFMSSLADDVADRSIGIVLSGTDHDGTLGLKAIKAVGGLTIAQTPDTAEFASMPQSAIAAEVVDMVLPPAAMPAAILEYLNLQPVDAELGSLGSDEVDSAVADRLNEILEVVFARSGNDFRHYRPAMLRRRLRRRMVLMHCDHLADYLLLLNQSADEALHLSREFLIGVTDFFRDTEAWQELGDLILPTLLANRRVEDQPIRVWTPGCSSGEESYSIAMLLQEQLEEKNLAGAIQVFGTDIDLNALAVARQGAYPLSIASTVSTERLARFFERRGEQYVVRKSLRDSVTFAPQNLIRDTPFSRLDLVLCRNVIMYFEPSLQEKVLQLFHFALQPGGLLWLGKAESLGTHGSMFEPVSRSTRLFRRVGGRSHLPRGFASKSGGTIVWKHRAAHRPPPAADILHRHIFQRSVTAAVLIDQDGRALHFQGDTARFLAPQGDASLELLRLVRQELRTAIRTVLREVSGQDQTIVRRAFIGSGSEAQPVTIEAEPATGADAHGLIVVTFTSAPADLEIRPPTTKDAAPGSPLQFEMEETRRELAVALEDAERSNQELRLASEEAFALNEELQSSNEELESSKEELQSLNEELATVNSQLEDRMAEAIRNTDDMTNLLASTHIATVLLDQKLRIRRFTPAATELFNLRTGDEGRQLSDISSRIDDPNFTADARAVLNAAPPIETELRSASGGTLLRRIQPFLTESRQILGIVATFVDITSLRTSAREVRELTAMLEDSSDAVFTYDLQGKILSWNKGAERIYGYRREQAIGADLFSLIATAAHDAAPDFIAEAVNSGADGAEDVDRRTSDGRIIRVSMALSALRDETGAVYALLSTERDITERLRAEREVRFQRLADDMPALLRVEDPLGLAQFVNRCCVEFTGEEREALRGRGWLQFVHPQDRERYLAEHAVAQAEQTRLESDVRLLRHDGVYRWMRSISVPHFDQTGAFAGHVALMLDIDDRRIAEEKLITADRRKDEFLAMLAHELRNPLAPISNAVALLSRSSLENQGAEWAVGVIQRQTDLLAKLLDSLLDVARIARGKTALELAPVEIRVVVDRAIELSKASIDSRRQDLTVNMPSEQISVEGDVTRLTQVFANLLNNASKYTQEGGAIRVDVALVGNEVEVRIGDNGAGIESDMLNRVFDLFAQADITLDRAKGGLGLGLTLVKQLVQLHRGSVQAESAGLGKGSTFTVRLPVLERASRISDDSGTAPLPRSANTESRRILVVDDNVEGAQTLASLLEMEGHEVAIAHDGVKAIALAERIQPDIILLDIGLPGLDGYQVARRLRGLSATAKTFLVALTGYGGAKDVARAHESGFDLHLVKPVDFNALFKAIAAAPLQSAKD